VRVKDDDELTHSVALQGIAARQDVERTLASTDADKEVGKHERDDRHQLHDDVDGGARRILEWVTNRVTNHSRLVRVTAACTRS
jgi:hypothetical protein